MVKGMVLKLCFIDNVLNFIDENVFPYLFSHTYLFLPLKMSAYDLLVLFLDACLLALLVSFSLSGDLRYFL